jgi:hypothetical protein
MTMTSFPHGITSMGVPVLPTNGAEVVAGNVFWVCSVAGGSWNAGVDSSGHGTKDNPFATIDYAIGKCTANNGDVIYVLPGHTESIIAAGTITCDVAGVSIIGLGNSNLRPTITWATSTAACWNISAANVTIKNILCTTSIDELVKLFYVTAAGVTLDTVDYVQGSSAQALQFLLTTNAADQLTIKNCNHRQTTATNGTTIWIQLVGTDNSRILNNTIWITAKAATASICISGSTAVVECEIVGNRIAWLGGTIKEVINLVTGSTGIISDNRVAGGAAVLLAAAITGDACYMFENYVTNTAAASGILGPGADTVT